MKRTSFAGPDKRVLISLVLGVSLLGGVVWTLLSAKNGGIPPRAPLPKPNGFDLYASAAKSLRWPDPPLDAIVDTKRRSPQETAKLYTPARRAAFVTANARVWELMQQARAAQTMHPDTRNFALSGNVMARLPYNSLRSLARGKVIETKHWKDASRWDLALQSGLDSMEMGRDIEHGATMIGSLVSMAMGTIGGASLEDVPPHLSGLQAAQGARRLEKIIAGGSAPSAVLLEEKWTMLVAASQGFAAQQNRMAGLIYRPLTAPIVPMMDGFIAQSDKPRAAQSAPPVPTGIFSALAAPLHPATQGYGHNAARRENMESQLLLRLALRAYRVENGAYPDNLPPLAPKYLSKVPRDAFGRGEVMRYRKSGDSYLVWSIGPDGKDNGGAPIPIKRGKKRVVIEPKSLGDAVARP